MYLSRALLTVILLTQTAQANVLSRQELSQKVEELSGRVDQLEKESGETQHPAVAFTATLSGGGRVSIDNSSIKFDNVETNIGNAYNSHTGEFTAPVAGTYGFLLTVKGGNIPDRVFVGIYTSSKTLAVTLSEGSGKDDADKGACFSTTHLNLGDTVFARRFSGQPGGSIIDKWYATSFSGFLITAD